MTDNLFTFDKSEHEGVSEELLGGMKESYAALQKKTAVPGYWIILHSNSRQFFQYILCSIYIMSQTKL